MSSTTSWSNSAAASLAEVGMKRRDALADELYDLMVDAIRAHQAEPTGD